MLSVHTASMHHKAYMRSVSEEEVRKQKEGEVRRKKGRQGGERWGKEEGRKRLRWRIRWRKRGSNENNRKENETRKRGVGWTS